MGRPALREYAPLHLGIPSEPGVYVLYQGLLAFYVGSSIDLHARIKYHNLRGQFDRVAYFPCATRDLVATEQRYINELSPARNRVKAYRRNSVPRTALYQASWAMKETPGQIALQCGLTYEAFSRIRDAGCPEIVALAERCGLTVEEIVYGRKHPHNEYPHLPLSDRIKAEHYRPRVGA